MALQNLRWVQAALLTATLFALGCSGDNGPKTYRVTGTVMFGGRPLPRGMIVFTPDLAQRNDGPQGVAQIKDGKYDTQATNGQGVVGGPMNVSITGLSAEERPLCQYDFALELPRQDTTKDIEVPSTAASKNAPFEGP